MPKRGSSVSDDSPRKVTRRNSKSSPGKSVEVVPALAEDAALMNISDEEMVDSAPPPPKLKSYSFNLESLQSFKAFRETFTKRFVDDIEKDESTPFDLEGYRSLLNEIPEEDPAEQRYLVDQHMRDFVIERLTKNRQKWDRFLELSIQLARDQTCSASLPISIISDFIELSTLQQCEEIFEFVESRLNVWKESFFLNSGKNAVLRMCNDLLRRLSRAQNTIFCGRILLFLSNYFPFSERSGLNIMSEFNSDNLTSYKKGDGSDDPEDKMETNEEQDDKLFEGMDLTIPGLENIVTITQEEKKKKVKVDYNLYVKFWSLQDFFRNPTQCYNKISWKSFSMYIQDVLGAFTSFKIEDTMSNLKSRSSSTNKKESTRSHSSINVVPKLGDDDLYFPKYLTNRRLLELQMGDPNFRRYFMVQLLIILQYLTTSVKFKSENQVLGEDQLEFVKKTIDRIFTLLRDIKPGGREFVKAVQHILKREDLWSKWKNDGCQSFKKPTVAVNVESDDKNLTPGGSVVPDSEEKSESQVSHKRRHLGDILEEAEKNNRYLLGNPELTRLWNICGDNLEACRAESRDFLPTIETFFVESFKELDPEPIPPHIATDPSKREIKQKKNLSNQNFGWRALRLLARNSPYFFQLAPSPPVQPLQNYLEYILKKIATDMEIPPVETEQDDNNMSENGNNEEQNKDSQQSVNANNDGDQVVEGEAEDSDELLKPDAKLAKEEQMHEEEEEGEVDEKVRNLTEEEQRALGRLLGKEWKALALKLQFTKDEILFFETEKGKDAGTYMLKMWTDQENEDATAADLLYQLEGLKLRELVREIFP